MKPPVAVRTEPLLLVRVPWGFLGGKPRKEGGKGQTGGGKGKLGGEKGKLEGERANWTKTKAMAATRGHGRALSQGQPWGPGPLHCRILPWSSSAPHPKRQNLPLRGSDTPKHPFPGVL